MSHPTIGDRANTQGVHVTSIQVTDLKITGNTATADVTLIAKMTAKGGHIESALRNGTRRVRTVQVRDTAAGVPAYGAAQ